MGGGDSFFSRSRNKNQQSEHLWPREPPPKIAIEVDLPPHLVGLVIGRRGSTLHRIQNSAGVFAYVHEPKPGDERAYVEVRGLPEQIDDAVNQLVAVVASVDKESARKLNPILVSEPRCGANEGTMSRKPDEVKLLEKIPSATAGGDGQGYPGEMTGKITIMAKPPLFKCLMGANGENFRKIKRECEANIHVEALKNADGLQHAYISGSVTDVLYAAQKVKTSLSWYNPTRDPQLKDGRGNWSKAEDLKVIRARATMKIIEDAGGFLIGTAGHNVKRIIEQTGVQSLDVDKIPDSEGLLDVHVVGDVVPVLKAVQEVEKSMKGYTPLCIRVPKSQSLKIDREQLEPEPEPLPFLSPVPADPTMPTSLSAVTTCMPSLTEPPRQEMGPLTWPQMPVPQLQLSLPTEAPPLAHSSFLTESAPLLQTSPPSLPQMSTPLQLTSQTSVTVYTIPSDGFNPPVAFLPSGNGSFVPMQINFQPLSGFQFPTDLTMPPLSAQEPQVAFRCLNVPHQAQQNETVCHLAESTRW